MFDNKKFGMAVRFLRKKKGYTLLNFALELNISDTYLSQIERGDKIPSVEIVVLILNELNLSIEDIDTFLETGQNNIVQNYQELLVLLDETDCEYLYHIMTAYERKDNVNV